MREANETNSTQSDTSLEIRRRIKMSLNDEITEFGSKRSCQAQYGNDQSVYYSTHSGKRRKDNDEERMPDG